MGSGERSRSVVREYFEALLVAGIFLSFTNTFVLKTFYIPSGSMEDTLLIGDHLFVNRYIYGSSPDGVWGRLLPSRPVTRGDVAVFRSPEDPRIDLVKRCVALGNDHVQMIDKYLYLNEQRVDDSAYAVRRDRHVYSIDSTNSQGKRRDNWGPVVVPRGSYFCMGDNRDHSYDSRFWGTVPSAFIKGRAVMVYWSFGGETPDGSWHGWGPKLRQLLKTGIGLPTQTRWTRSFRIIR
jgi:signal peptidase I